MNYLEFKYLSEMLMGKGQLLLILITITLSEAFILKLYS